MVTRVLVLSLLPSLALAQAGWPSGGGYQTVQSSGTSVTKRSKLNIVGATVADDPTNKRTTVSMLLGAGSAASARLYVTRTTDTAVVAYTLVKAGTTAGRVQQFATTDAATKVTGVALSAAGGAAASVNVLELAGVQCPILSDGTTVIAVGDLVEPSPTSNGRIRKGSTNPIGVAMSAAVAVADTPVDVL